MLEACAIKQGGFTSQIIMEIDSSDFIANLLRIKYLKRRFAVTLNVMTSIYPFCWIYIFYIIWKNMTKNSIEEKNNQK